jgi:16S rRNA (uracil1498-N3)-methyltransferase
VAVPFVFVADVDDPVLSDDDRHHLERVLRVGASDAVVVCDGRGRWVRCRYGTTLEPAGSAVDEPRPSPALTVAFALTKGRRPELAVQKLTESGVDVIRPFVAERSVVRWDEARSTRHHDRLVRVAREAAMQCRRAFLPEVAPVATFESVASAPGVALADRSGRPPTLEHPAVLVGPEGGWSPAELERDLPRVALAATVLRAETAAIAAGVVLAALREGLVHPSPDDGDGK